MLASSRGLSLRSPSLRPRPRSTRPFTTSCSATSSRTRSVCSRTASRCWARPRWRPSASSAWPSSRTARLTFRCWQAAVGGVAGVLLAGLSTQVVKHVACRARPRLVDGWGVGPPMPPDRAQARVLSLAVLRGAWLPRVPVGSCGHGVRGRRRPHRMGTRAASLVDSRLGVWRGGLADRAECSLPVGCPRRRALRLVGWRTRGSPGDALPCSPVARALAGTGAPESGGRVSPTCLVVHPGALGDVLLAVPALAHLRALGFRTTLAVPGRLVAALPGLEPRGRRGGPRRRPRPSRPLRGAAGCQRASCPCWLRCDRVVVRGGRSGVSREPRRPGPSGGGGASRAIAGLRPPCQPSPRGDPRAARAAPDCRSLDATPCGGNGPGQGEGVAGRPGTQASRCGRPPARRGELGQGVAGLRGPGRDDSGTGGSP